MSERTTISVFELFDMIPDAELALSSVRAALHQMTHGEASDFIDADTEPFSEGTVGAEENEARRDLQWCRTQLKEAVKILS